MSASFHDRLIAALALLTGATGVVLSAAAAHLGSGPSLETAARFLILHAPALVAILAAQRAGLLHAGAARFAGWGLLLGVMLFSGDLATRAIYGIAPIPMAAPTGGILLIAGWCLAALAAFLPSRSR